MKKIFATVATAVALCAAVSVQARSLEAIQKAGHSGKIDIALDVAASEFYDSKTGKYNLS